MSRPDVRTRLAGIADARAIGQLLHDCNSEFEEPTPAPRVLAERIRQLLAADHTAVLLAGAGPYGLAVLRFRPAIRSPALECYLAELYVIPDHRGHGIGRGLMQAAIDLARTQGADHIDLATSEDDTAARGLYESLGFTNRESKPDGPITYYYQREL